MGCLSGLTKYILFLFNFIIVCCAILLITFGAIFLKNNDKGVDSDVSDALGGVAIAVGVIIFLIAFFGCCGAIKENSCLLTTYAAILIILFILQVALGVWAFIAIKDDDNALFNEIRKAVQKLFDQYNNADKMELIDDLQKDLECCGVNGPEYWKNPISVPKSCCNDATVCTIVNAYHQGCAKAFTNLITDNAKIIGGVAIGFGVVELVGAIFACIVRNRR